MIKKVDNAILLENININLISIIILMNSLKLAILWNFGININMWIEYIIIVILLIVNKVKINNIKNLMIIAITMILFAANFLFNETDTLHFYFEEFVLFAVPLLIVFLIDIDLKKFLKTFLVYNIINIILYLLTLVLNKDILQTEYMTFGFYAISSNIYIMLYFYYNKNRKMFILSILLIPIVCINGNRSVLLIVSTAIVLMLLYNFKGPIKKTLIISVFILLIIFIKPIMLFVLDELTGTFDISNNYSVRNIYRILESDSLEETLGGRYEIYMEGLQEINENPVLGIGIASFQDKYGYFPHNIVIDIYVTFGIIFGTIYIMYLVYLGVRLNKIAKENVEIKILFIFMVANIMKLMLSKTFIYDSSIWIYISLGNLIITKYARARRAFQNEKMYQENTSKIQE